MNGQDDIMDMLMPLILLMVGLAGLWFLYTVYSVEINTGLIFAAKWALYPFAFFFDDAARGINYLSTLNPASFGLEGVSLILTKVGGYIRWPIALMLSYFGFRSLYMGLDKWNRRLSLRGLMDNNITDYPSIAPAIHVNIMELSQQDGPWRVTEDAIVWAIKHQALVKKKLNGKYERLTKKHVSGVFDENGALRSKWEREYTNEGVQLDRANASKAYIKQLGPKLTDFSNMPDYARALAAAFITFGIGKRTDAYEMLGDLAISYDSPDDANSSLDTVKKWHLDMGDSDEVLAENAQEIERITALHSTYLYTWLTELLEYARRKGELAPSRFIWLRPINRTLWYSLNQLGGRMPHFEASAVWAHMEAEKVLGQTISEPEIAASIKSLDYELKREGWIAGAVR